jgi:hypothetical protein
MALPLHRHQGKEHQTTLQSFQKLSRFIRRNIHKDLIDLVGRINMQWREVESFEDFKTEIFFNNGGSEMHKEGSVQGVEVKTQVLGQASQFEPP